MVLLWSLAYGLFVIWRTKNHSISGCMQEMQLLLHAEHNWRWHIFHVVFEQWYDQEYWNAVSESIRIGRSHMCPWSDLWPCALVPLFSNTSIFWTQDQESMLKICGSLLVGSNYWCRVPISFCAESAIARALAICNQLVSTLIFPWPKRHLTRMGHFVACFLKMFFAFFCVVSPWFRVDAITDSHWSSRFMLHFSFILWLGKTYCLEIL